MSKEKAPHITLAKIEEFLDREERRKAAARLAADLERENETLKSELKKYVELEGGKGKSVERSGYVLAFKTRAGRVEWKSEFISVAGIDEAERLTRECPKSEFLSVEKAG